MIKLVIIAIWGGSSCMEMNLKRAVCLLLLLSCTACRGSNVVNDTINDLMADRLSRPQRWTAAQTQGKLQPFPPEVTEKLQRILDRHVGHEKLPGVVLYISTSDGNWMGAAGKANLEAGTDLKPIERFRIAGLTQLFVAVVCLQLAEDDVLDLDAPIGRYLPQAVSSKISNSQWITVRQLLNHTSGLPNLYAEEALKQAIQATPTHKWTATELLEYIYQKKSASPRGVFSYSDANYLLLELIVEKTTGRPLAKAIRSRILEPLGLSNTFMELQEPIPNGFAQGYQGWIDKDSAKTVMRPLLNSGLGLGNAGLVSSAPDLARFFQALFTEDTLLQPRSLDQLLTHVGERERWGYGLGITYIPTRWGEAWGQTGKITGFMSAIAYLPVHDLTIIIWTNDDDDKLGDPWEVIKRSLEVILGSPR